MDRKLADEFLREATEKFKFVVEEYSFVGPEFEIDDGVDFVFVTFVGKNLAIEVSLDGREGDIECHIARVKDGRRATYRDSLDEFDKQGTRVREHLFKLLWRRGVRERLFTKVGGLQLRERIPITLEDFAQMLKKHGRIILMDTYEVLE